MKKIFLFPFLYAAFAILMASYGSSTRVVSSWKSPDASVSNMDNILVLAMMADRETKDYIERTLVADLSARGVAAATGTSEFGPRGFGDMNQKQVARRLSKKGYSGILIVSLTAKDQDVRYVPGIPYTGYYGRYRYMWNNVYSPGYYETYSTYVLDADLFSIADDKLIYSAQTRTYDPSGSQQLARSFSEQIVTDLREQQIVP